MLKKSDTGVVSSYRSPFSRDKLIPEAIRSLVNKISGANVQSVTLKIVILIRAVTDPRTLDKIANMIFNLMISSKMFIEHYAYLMANLFKYAPRFRKDGSSIELTFKALIINLCQESFSNWDWVDEIGAKLAEINEFEQMAIDAENEKDYVTRDEIIEDIKNEKNTMEENLDSKLTPIRRIITFLSQLYLYDGLSLNEFRAGFIDICADFVELPLQTILMWPNEKQECATIIKCLAASLIASFIEITGNNVLHNNSAYLANLITNLCNTYDTEDQPNSVKIALDTKTKFAIKNICEKYPNECPEKWKSINLKSSNDVDNIIITKSTDRFTNHQFDVDNDINNSMNRGPSPGINNEQRDSDGLFAPIAVKSIPNNVNYTELKQQFNALPDSKFPGWLIHTIDVN